MKNNNPTLNLNAIRMLGVQAINKANSGHPGIVLGAAPIMYTLFTKVINASSTNSKWFNRDRFVLSAGHGSALLYATLHLSGYNVTINDLKEFRQLNSKTPGHPELGHTDGVEITTGPLGQGVGMAVGMAVAETFLASKFNKPKFNIIDHFTYVLAGDGDLQEGISQEAISFAGKQKLNKLVLIHDSNDVQLDDKVSEANVENLQERFKSANWNTLLVKDGEDLKAIEEALIKAKNSDKPTYIEVKTIIGKGSPKQGTSATHGSPLGNDLGVTKAFFNWEYEDFVIPDEVYDFYKNITKQNDEKIKQWDQLMEDYKNQFSNDYKTLVGAIDQDWKIDLETLDAKTPEKTEASRVSSGNIFKSIMEVNPTMIGGSADLASSTRIKGLDGNFNPENRSGRNIMYGVREFGMAAINNGMAAHGGILPVASGFFVFSDYMKPAMRLSAIMKLQSLYIFTHDSIAVGEDGPTHQPIEQLTMLRSIPNHNLFRPADYAETKAAYQLALKAKNTPSSIVLTRQDIGPLPHKNVLEEVSKGAYIVSEQTNPQVTLIGTGSEVTLALNIQKELNKQNINSCVVSMPNMRWFDNQSVKYKNTVLKKDTFRVSLEMGSSYGWEKYVGEDGMIFGIDQFGASAPGDQLQIEYGFDANLISQKIIMKLTGKK